MPRTFGAISGRCTRWRVEIQGYRQALGYVLAMGDTEYTTFDATEIRAMYYLMLSHDHTKSPGRYRKGPIYVHDERNDRVVRQIQERRRARRQPLRDPTPG